jgi:hypothetical protein
MFVREWAAVIGSIDAASGSGKFFRRPRDNGFRHHAADDFPAWSSGRPLPQKLGIKARPHMLSDACSYKLANEGLDTRATAFPGHRHIQNTTRYTALPQNRSKVFWRD